MLRASIWGEKNPWNDECGNHVAGGMEHTEQSLDTADQTPGY